MLSFTKSLHLMSAGMLVS